VTAATNPDSPVPPGPADELTILLGRFMLPDLSEHPCQVSQLTADGALFGASFQPPLGLTIIAYIDGIGRVEGRCERPAGNGFEVAFLHVGPGRTRFEKRLKWLNDAKSGRADFELRSSARDHPNESVSQIALFDGRTYACEVLDISPTGAAVKIDIMPTLGSHVTLGKMRGRVVRHIEHGVAIEFVGPMERPFN
jgi:hypothetical protein